MEAGLFQDDNEAISLRVWRELQGNPETREQLDRLMKGTMGAELDSEFLGFLDVYSSLSRLIPHSRTIYDLGCGYALQAWLFRDHAAYLGVDLLPEDGRLALPNVTHIQDHLKTYLAAGPVIPAEAFAICSYVPIGVDIRRTIAGAFASGFFFYPVVGDFPLVVLGQSLTTP